MNLKYERTEYFDGEPSKAIEIARNTFLPYEFEIVESSDSYLEVANNKFPWGHRPNPIKMISNAGVSFDSRKITLRAELGVIKKIILFLVLFMVGMLALFLIVFGYTFVIQQGKSASLLAWNCLYIITTFALIIPIAVIWFNVKSRQVLDILFNNMIISGKPSAKNLVPVQKFTAQQGLIFFLLGGLLLLSTILLPFLLNANGTQTAKPLFEQLNEETISFISEQYEETISRASLRNLYASCHIFYVNDRFISCKGGMGYFRNRTGTATTDRIRISGTNQLEQSFYDSSMQKLDVEFIRDRQRADLYHIYYTPVEPIEAGQTFYYFFSIDKSRQLGPDLNRTAALTMQNHPGSNVIETFFLVLPKTLRLVPSNSVTSSRQLDNFDVYWWSKQVSPNEDHVEEVEIVRR